MESTEYQVEKDRHIRMIARDLEIAVHNSLPEITIAYPEICALYLALTCHGAGQIAMRELGKIEGGFAKTQE